MPGHVSHCSSCRECDRQAGNIHVLPLQKTVTIHNPGIDKFISEMRYSNIQNIVQCLYATLPHICSRRHENFGQVQQHELFLPCLAQA